MRDAVIGRFCDAHIRFGFELFVLMVWCISSSVHLLPSSVADLESANLSSRERWRFVTSNRFQVLIVGYFPFVLVLNRIFGLPDDLGLLAGQLVGIAVLFALTFCSTLAISAVLEASLRFPVAVFTTTISIVEQLSDVVPAVLTPPPDCLDERIFQQRTCCFLGIEALRNFYVIFGGGNESK